MIYIYLLYGTLCTVTHSKNSLFVFLGMCGFVSLCTTDRQLSQKGKVEGGGSGGQCAEVGEEISQDAVFGDAVAIFAPVGLIRNGVRPVDIGAP